MKISGFGIMDRLDALKEQGTLLDTKFAPSLYKFEDEEKPTPESISSDYLRVEESVAVLQEAQSKLNLKVKVKFSGVEITLEKAIKLIGVYGRLKNQWKIAAGFETAATKRAKLYSYDDGSKRTREPGVENAKRQITQAEAEAQVEFFTKLCADLKFAIREGNARLVELDLDPLLFTGDAAKYVAPVV